MHSRKAYQSLGVHKPKSKPLDFNDTSQLQQFINVDFDQINKEREKHLQQALSSTLKERRTELQQCE